MNTLAWRHDCKGGHPVCLNFANCISYALEKRADEPLLVIGNGLIATDVEVP